MNDLNTPLLKEVNDALQVLEIGDELDGSDILDLLKGYQRLLSAQGDWRPINTAPEDGVYVLVIFEDGDIALARNCGAQDGHNGWWSMDGLDFGYGSSNPIGWLPREALPLHPHYTAAVTKNT